jgi:hypothetical protein
MTHYISEDMRACIQECTNCHNICMETAAHCLSLEGAFAAPGTIGVLLDCARICTLNAEFMLRASPLHARLCGLSVEACERCAIECEGMADGDHTIRTCARACRRTIDSCRRLAA